METLQISQTKASRHLSTLKNTGLVEDRKHAQWVYYSLIKNDNFKFIDSLIFDNLRNLEQFKEDLKNLDEWVSRKEIICD
jgi:ArsR family transcriptional regulator, arsenate/arsenite/antimonite-responsive transcriptional repressor